MAAARRVGTKRQLEGEAGSAPQVKRGRGKAGHVRVQGNQLIPVSVPDPTERKDSWKCWLERYINENTDLVSSASGPTLECTDCSKTISKLTFVNHRTKNGCRNINPKIRLKYWK